MDHARIDSNRIPRLSVDLAVAMIAFHETLVEQKKFVISNQMLRAATSVGANAFEAQQAESKADFIQKMKIAAKEAAETQFLLLVCERAKGYTVTPQLKDLVGQIDRL